MEFTVTHVSVLALFCLALVGIDASQSGEDYWHSVWPNTPLPKSLSDLLLSDSQTNLPIRAEEEKQYWTVFFKHDLHPGKKMSLGLHNYKYSFGARTWGEEREKTNQPFGAWRWGETHKDSIDDFCRSPAAIGEDKSCAASLKSMMDFAISKLGTNIKVVSSSFAENQDQYMVEEVKKIGDQAVMCHRLNFKKVVFYCHQVNATTTYTVPLMASDGTKAKALTICHHDTRGMDHDVLYEVLNVKPGSAPVCHFVGNKAVAWVPNHAVSDPSDRPCVT